MATQDQDGKYKRAGQALRESEERFRLLVENAPGAIFVQTQHRFAYLNPAALRCFGAESSGQLLGQPVLDRYDARFHAQVKERIRLLNEEKKNVPVQEQIILKVDGSPFDIELSAAPIRWGDHDGALVFFRDITERKRAEEALRQSDAALRNAQRVAHVGSWKWHIQSNQLEWSDEMYRIFGIAAENFTGDLTEVIHRAIHPEDRAKVEQVNLSVIQDKRPVPLEYRVIWPDGTVRVVWAEAGELVLDAAGNPAVLTGIVQDITDRKRAEAAVRESETRYRSLFDNMAEGYAYCRMLFEDGRPRDFIYLAVNAAFEKLTGLLDVVGKKVSKVIPGIRETNPELFEIYGRVALTGRPERFETFVKALDLWFSVSVYSPAKEHFVAVFDVITERKRAEAELRASREQLRALAAHLQTVREEERTRVAREIHDVLAQELTRLKIDLAWLERRLAKPGKTAAPEALAARVAEMSQMADAAINCGQRIATGLRPAVLDSLGLCAAVEWQARDFQAHAGIQCHASVPEKELPVDRDAATATFRILQESLTNVLRHAHATRVEVSLRQEAGQLVLRVEDNGCGVRTEALTSPMSIGLTGMRERALLLGGQLEIRSQLGSGTTVEMRLPLAGHEKFAEGRP